MYIEGIIWLREVVDKLILKHHVDCDNIGYKLKLVLKPEGSLWLNIGDTYVNKNLVGVPWRVALALL